MPMRDAVWFMFHGKSEKINGIRAQNKGQIQGGISGVISMAKTFFEFRGEGPESYIIRLTDRDHIAFRRKVCNISHHPNAICGKARKSLMD